MQKNLVLVGFVLFVLLFVGVVLFKKRDIPPRFPPATKPTQAPQNPTLTITQNAANIVVSSPKPQDTVQFPLIMTGLARVFENLLNYRILDEKGNILSQGNTTANSPDVGEFGPFTITIKDLDTFTQGKISIEVFDYSAKDGSEIDKVTIPVTLQ